MKIPATLPTSASTETGLPHFEDCPVYFDDYEALIERGSRDGRCYVILEGAVEILRDGRFISAEGPGSIVGELSLVDNGPASADVIATSPTVAIPISRERFRSLMQEHPDFGLTVMRVMADRLRRMNRKL